MTSKNLVSAILDQWPSYFAFALSFTTILIMWINHHARMSLVDRIDGLLMFANGFLMMTIVALSYPTALVGEYLNTPAGRAAAVTYGLAVLATSGAWNIFMLALRPERGLLRPGVPPEVIATTRRRVALGFVIYLVATGLAAVNAYLGLGIMTAMWVFWATFAYRALNRHERWSADASSGETDADIECVTADVELDQPGRSRSSSSQRARSFSSRPTAAAVALLNGSSSWIAATRKHPGLAVGGGVDLADQSVAVQHRQRVVAPQALGRGLVHLELVVEAEQLERALAIVHQPVERRQQRGAPRERTTEQRRVDAPLALHAVDDRGLSPPRRRPTAPPGPAARGTRAMPRARSRRSFRMRAASSTGTTGSSG